MLVGNGIRLQSNPARFIFAASSYVSEPGNFHQYGARKNFFIGQHANAATRINGSQPSGTCHPYAWLWPIKGGGLTSRNILSGAGTLTGQLYQGVALASDLDGSCTVTAGLDLTTSMAADLTGVGTVTAALDSTTALAADLSGTGTVTAGLSLIVGMTGALSGTGTVTAGLTGTLDMAADITVSAVQDFPTADENAAAVMAYIVEAGYDVRDILAMLSAVHLGTSTGFPTSPAFKGLDETTTRVNGTLDGNGNRSAVVLNP